MIATVRFLFAAFPLAAVLASACGQADDASFAKTVAADFRKSCESPEQQAQATNEAMGRHLDRLCACTEARIAATPMRPADGDDSINRKIRAAMADCLNEIGGAPGEGRSDQRQ